MSCFCKVHPCFHDMSPEDQEAQRQSWVRGEMELAKDPREQAHIDRRVQGERRKHREHGPFLRTWGGMRQRAYSFDPNGDKVHPDRRRLDRRRTK